MIDINQQQILNKISSITFSDNTKLIDIISNIVIKDKNIGFAIDIFGKDPKEVDEIKIKAINKLNEIANIGKITIVLTSSKNLAKNQLIQKLGISLME